MLFRAHVHSSPWNTRLILIFSFSCAYCAHVWFPISLYLCFDMHYRNSFVNAFGFFTYGCRVSLMPMAIPPLPFLFCILVAPLFVFCGVIFCSVCASSMFVFTLACHRYMMYHSMFEVVVIAPFVACMPAMSAPMRLILFMISTVFTYVPTSPAFVGGNFIFLCQSDRLMFPPQ